MKVEQKAKAIIVDEPKVKSKDFFSIDFSKSASESAVPSIRSLMHMTARPDDASKQWTVPVIISSHDALIAVLADTVVQKAPAQYTGP